MEQSIQSERAGLHVFPRAGQLKRSFKSCVEYGAKASFTVADRIRGRRIRQKKIGNQRVVTGLKDGFAEVPGLVVIGRSKPCSRHDGKPAKVSIRVKELMKCINTRSPVVLKARAFGKTPM